MTEGFVVRPEILSGPASSFAEREWHARDNPDFLLLGREHGFVVAGADSTADADDVAAAGDEAAAEGVGSSATRTSL